VTKGLVTADTGTIVTEDQPVMLITPVTAPTDSPA
jgi:hypothetical protein